jgi:hypothetical protein
MIAETLPNILAYMSAARQNRIKYYNAFAIMGLGIPYYCPSHLTYETFCWQRTKVEQVTARALRVQNGEVLNFTYKQTSYFAMEGK